MTMPAHNIWIIVNHPLYSSLFGLLELWKGKSQWVEQGTFHLLIVEEEMALNIIFEYNFPWTLGRKKVWTLIAMVIGRFITLSIMIVEWEWREDICAWCAWSPRSFSPEEPLNNEVDLTAHYFSCLPRGQVAASLWVTTLPALTLPFPQSCATL